MVTTFQLVAENTNEMEVWKMLQIEMAEKN